VPRFDCAHTHPRRRNSGKLGIMRRVRVPSAPLRKLALLSGGRCSSPATILDGSPHWQVTSGTTQYIVMRYRWVPGRAHARDFRWGAESCYPMAHIGRGSQPFDRQKITKRPAPAALRRRANVRRSIRPRRQEFFSAILRRSTRGFAPEGRAAASPRIPRPPHCSLPSPHR